MDTMVTEYPDNAQRFAICNGQISKSISPMPYWRQYLPQKTSTVIDLVHYTKAATGCLAIGVGDDVVLQCNLDEDWPLKNHSVEVIRCSNIFENLVDIGKSVIELGRVVAENGVALVTVKSSSDCVSYWIEDYFDVFKHQFDVENLYVRNDGGEKFIDCVLRRKALTTADFPEGSLTIDQNHRKKPRYSAAIIKATDEKQYTFGVVYKATNESDEPELDAHSEFATADELQESLWDYVKAGKRDIFIQHGMIEGLGFKKAGEFVEIVSWPMEVEVELTLPGGKVNKTTIPANSIFMGVLWQDWSWKLVKEGKIRGYSFAGLAKRVKH